MNIKHASSIAALWVVGIVLTSAPQSAHAQGTIAPVGSGRFYVELKDASLADALELVFKAAGNTSYIIDEYAREVNVASITFNNVQWDSIVRQLANQNNFLVRRNETGTYVIEPRNPPPAETEGENGGSGYNGAFPRPGGAGSRPNTNPRRPPASSGMPPNPFGAPINRGGAKIVANSQTAPGLEDDAATAGDDEGKEYHLIIVKHVYEGGIAGLFGESTIVSTEEFLTPAGSGGFGGSGGGFGGGGFGGGGNSGGGFGGF